MKLLRFECTAKDAGEVISLQEYADNHMQGGKQKNIYYFSAPNRDTEVFMRMKMGLKKSMKKSVVERAFVIFSGVLFCNSFGRP